MDKMTRGQIHELFLRLSAAGAIGFFFLWAFLRIVRKEKQRKLITLHKGWRRFAHDARGRFFTMNWKAQWLPPTFISDWKEAGFDKPSKAIWASAIACLLCVASAYCLDRGWL